jgi:hypothetical protein
VIDGLKEISDYCEGLKCGEIYEVFTFKIEKFKACMEIEKIQFKGLLCLDVPTRWNSTYKILEAA